MRTLLAIFILALTTQVLADNIKCYSSGKLIYQSEVSDITMTPNGAYVFNEGKTNHTMIADADCIIRITNPLDD